MFKTILILDTLLVQWKATKFLTLTLEFTEYETQQVSLNQYHAGLLVFPARWRPGAGLWGKLYVTMSGVLWKLPQIQALMSKIVGYLEQWLC